MPSVIGNFLVNKKGSGFSDALTLKKAVSCLRNEYKINLIVPLSYVQGPGSSRDHIAYAF